MAIHSDFLKYIQIKLSLEQKYKQQGNEWKPGIKGNVFQMSFGSMGLDKTAEFKATEDDNLLHIRR